MDKRPIVGITMGDPAGNGPELTVKALTHREVYDWCRPLVIGDGRVLEASVAIAGAAGWTVRPVERGEDAQFQVGTIDVYHQDLVEMDKLEYGKVSPMCGRAAFL